MATAPVVRHAPQPLGVPLSGDMDQRLAQIVSDINGLRSVAVRPNVAYLTMTDELGQSWKVSIDSTGTLHTSVIPR